MTKILKALNVQGFFISSRKRAWHYFSCHFYGRMQALFMNETVASQSLLQLLVRVYNQSIQSYYFFPDVIICGSHRLEREEFETLLREGYITPYHTDSFGKLYRLTKKADDFLQSQLHRRKHRSHKPKQSSPQTHLAFC